MTLPPKRDLPLNFRTETVKAILKCVSAGDSCSLIGIGSVGKSNLLRFLQRADVRQTYLGEDWQAYLLAYIDLNKLLKPSLWGLLELMLHQLLVEATGHSGADEITRQTIDELYQRATQPKTKYLALRYLDRAIGLVCNQLGLRIIFLIDEFDELCRRLPARAFAALRALRDDYKYQLMYVVATRLEVARLRAEPLEIEAFEELISSHTIWLGPYGEEGARDMLSRLETRYNTPLEAKLVDEVLRLSGGHPGLLREVYYLARQPQPSLTQAARNSTSLAAECRRIWLSLPPEEQQVLSSLAHSAALPASQAKFLDRLAHKGMVKKSGINWEVFSPLLAEFSQQQSPAAAPIQLDSHRRTLWISGYETPKLTQLEYKLIAFLAQRPGQICTRDELAHHLYPLDTNTWQGDGVSDNRLDSIIKRLRKKIEPHPQEPRYLVTVHGHGFQLVNNADE